MFFFEIWLSYVYHAENVKAKKRKDKEKNNGTPNNIEN